MLATNIHLTAKETSVDLGFSSVKRWGILPDLLSSLPHPKGKKKKQPSLMVLASNPSTQETKPGRPP